MKYVVLLRGINVGGKNKIPMVQLKLYLEEAGFDNVKTFIQSGNAILVSDLDAKKTRQKIESMLSKKFKLDSELIKILALTEKELRSIVKNKPKGFGEYPDKYHSDVIFLINLNTKKAMSAFTPKEGIDKVWPGKGVIYSQRLSDLRAKSRLNKIVLSPLYKSMTIRNWNTTTKLLDLLTKISTTE